MYVVAMTRIGQRTHRTSGNATIQFARALCKDMTDAEELSWDRLQKKSLDGFRCRRQHPITKMNSNLMRIISEELSHSYVG
jgi:very-short-patch-repair endonuclease